MGNTLHVTNGDQLTNKLIKLKVEGDFAVWREMLCEGKTVVDLTSEEFRNTRISFFKKHYPEQAASYDDTFGSQLAIIADAYQYKDVVLWFEYDLFCHINTLACISFLKAIGFKGNIYLICSGWVENETQLKTLVELSQTQIIQQFQNKILLNKHDIFLADDLWRIYCGNNHVNLKPNRAKDSNFKYLSNCISAHKERFPHLGSGLNTLETNMLQLIRKYNIKTKHQLCGYMLNYQGYYGYRDDQILKMIERMHSFFSIVVDHLELTSKGKSVLDENLNVISSMEYICNLGGTLKYDYTYNSENHQLSKI